MSTIPANEVPSEALPENPRGASERLEKQKQTPDVLQTPEQAREIAEKLEELAEKIRKEARAQERKAA